MPSLSFTCPSPTSSTVSPSLNSRSFIERFREVSALYHCRAEAFRLTLQPTSHARRRAALLNLQVDTKKAVKCDQRQVSNVPLPIIDTEPSPPPVAAFPELQWVHEEGQSLPLSVGSSSSGSSSTSEEDEDGERDMDLETSDASLLVEEWDMEAATAAHAAAAAAIQRPSNHPTLRCAIPSIPTIIYPSQGQQYAQEPQVEEEDLRSYFSPDYECSAITLTPAKSSCISFGGHRQSIASVLEECMVGPDDELQYPPLDAETGPLPITIAAPHPQRRYLQPGLEVPSEAHRMSWGCGESVSGYIGEYEMEDDEYVSSSSSASVSSAYSSGATTESSASDLDTPRSAGSLRSSSEVESDITEQGEICEKRPRFERKDWVHPYARRSANGSLRSSSRR
ncbi:hypothetical protein EST38_g2367 [Candolleomyces aberdarensis]|uniref:Uncharacterized protein n=1 Tax=Candolleomyces aberdarensis TaxID=2316362 RepID=A0A4V1Q4W1_9AGAR|nr:hypothetical protein EST38_g2367 [Candolleomyces aberdarensis]